MNPRSEGWFEEMPHAVAIIVAAGLPTQGRINVPQIDGPLIAAGAVMTAPGADHAHTVGFAFPVREAGRMIAAMQEWASRNGLEYALQSAVDQGRAWARAAPR